MMVFRLTAALMLLASPSMAQEIACRYTAECFEGEACQSTDFSLTLRNEPGRENEVTLITDAETLRGTVMQKDGPDHAVFAGDTALHVVTTASDMSSLYTIHMEGLMAITYQGTCEATN